MAKKEKVKKSKYLVSICDAYKPFGTRANDKHNTMVEERFNGLLNAGFKLITVSNGVAYFQKLRKDEEEVYGIT